MNRFVAALWLEKTDLTRDRAAHTCHMWCLAASLTNVAVIEPWYPARAPPPPPPEAVNEEGLQHWSMRDATVR